MKDPRPQKNKALKIENIGVSPTAIPSYAVTVPAGDQGVVVDFNFKAAPILNAGGTDVGEFDDTSLATAGTIFTKLVKFKLDADLAEGEYWVDHLTGNARGKKATAGTTQSWSHSVHRTSVDAPSLDHPKKQVIITPHDDTDLSGVVTKGIMIFGLASGSTCTLNMQLENESEAKALPFLGSGSPYIFYPGSIKHIKATGTTLSGATVYGLGD